MLLKGEIQPGAASTAETTAAPSVVDSPPEKKEPAKKLPEKKAPSKKQTPKKKSGGASKAKEPLAVKEKAPEPVKEVI